MGGRVPVLWITGPAGIGKSAVSWPLFAELASSGARAAFIDADQLCMCYPAPPDDPGRDRIRARNASVVIGNYRAAGARCVIVSGVVDPALGVQRDLIEHATVMVCRLRADRDEVVRRLAGRDQRGAAAAGAVLPQVRAECDSGGPYVSVGGCGQRPVHLEGGAEAMPFHRRAARLIHRQGAGPHSVTAADLGERTAPYDGAAPPDTTRAEQTVRQPLSTHQPGPQTAEIVGDQVVHTRGDTLCNLLLAVAAPGSI